MQVYQRLAGVAATRHAFTTTLKEAAERARHDMVEAAILAIVLDDYEAYSARFGAAAATCLANEEAQKMKRALPPLAECFARWDDDTFVVLLPNTNPFRARLVAESLREHARCSIGIASTNDLGASDAFALVAQADGAALKARNMGGNRVFFGALPRSML